MAADQIAPEEEEHEVVPLTAEELDRIGGGLFAESYELM
jgi:hypothetical protein